MTNLTGSPKQIAWATQIRENQIAELDDLTTVPKLFRMLANNGLGNEEMSQRGVNSMETAASFCETIKAPAKASLLGQVDSKWWIDHECVAAYDAVMHQINLLK